MYDDATTISDVGSDSSNVWFSPNTGTYAVIRINAIEMMRCFEDDIALEAAGLIQPKSYPICLTHEMDLPFPNKPWYRYQAQPIAPHLPPANQTKGYTSEMCIPIFPNVSHPTGREPVRPGRPLPYGNCYHWIDHTIEIRVRARPEGFDETNAVRITPRTQSRIDRIFTDDHIHARKEAEAAQKKTREIGHSDAISPVSRSRPPSTHDAGDATIPRPSAELPQNMRSTESASHAALDDSHIDAASVFSHWSTSSKSVRGPMASVEDIMRMDIFTGPDEDLDLVPLVDLWPDLTENLKEDDIASPLELYKEIETIQGIVQQARIRAYAALTSPVPGPHTQGSEPGALDRRWTRLSRTAYHTLCAPVRRLASHVKRRAVCAQVPYLVVWP